MSYAGDVTPLEAWKLLADDPRTVLVDVRTEAEWCFVGVPDLSSLGREAIFIEWNNNDGTRNGDFLAELRRRISFSDNGIGGEEGRSVLFLCRSGGRSVAAAEAATAAGIVPAYNVLDGFEGHPNTQRDCGEIGWRAEGLPWKRQ